MKRNREQISEFDFSMLLPVQVKNGKLQNEVCVVQSGRRFGKPLMYYQTCYAALLTSWFLGECMFGYMSRKNQKRLNRILRDYIFKRICE